MGYAPIFCQVKDLIKIHNSVKFHQYSICGRRDKNLQRFPYRLSIHEMAISKKLLGPYSPKYGQ